MENVKYKNFVENAKLLCEMTQKMQDILLDLFFDEFVELDELEKNWRCQQEKLPF